MSEKRKHSKEDIEATAAMVTQLIELGAFLLPKLDILKDTAESAADTHLTAMSAMPIMLAMGQDADEKVLEAQIRAKRAKALYQFIKTIKDTEDDRAEFRKEQKAKEQGRATLNRALGLN